MFNDAFSWLTQDPIGKKVGIGLLIALGIVAIYAAASMLKWAGENIKPLMFCALVIGGVVYLQFTSERPRLNILTPDGSASFQVMNFRQPIPVKPPPDGWYHRVFTLGDRLRRARLQAKNCRARRIGKVGKARSIATFPYLPFLCKRGAFTPLGAGLSEM